MVGPFMEEATDLTVFQLTVNSCFSINYEIAIMQK